jgi:hypothetical protein
MTQAQIAQSGDEQDLDLLGALGEVFDLDVVEEDDALREAFGKPPDQAVNIDPDSVQQGLVKLVLTLIRMIHDVLERQAIRRIDGGGLTDEEIERLGVTLMRQAQAIEQLREQFDLAPEDLNLELGPLGKLC